MVNFVLVKKINFFNIARHRNKERRNIMESILKGLMLVWIVQLAVRVAFGLMRSAFRLFTSLAFLCVVYLVFHTLLGL